MTPPRTNRLIPRERLFRSLAAVLQQGVVWVAAPPGAGKTALVASFLETQVLPVIWYRVDEGDGDVADLFHFLALATQHLLPAEPAPLPRFAPEVGTGLKMFSRRFFRDLFGSVPGPCLLVIDDLHQVADDALLHDALAEGLAELPADVSVILTSRNAPAPAWATLRAKDQLAVLDWQALRLTDAEAAAIARQRAPGITDREIVELVRRAEGWAAGLILLLSRQAGRANRNGEAAPAATPAVVFDYFAREIWGAMDPGTRGILAKSVLLPIVTAAGLERLTGEPGAISAVARLYRSNYFTSRLAEGEYQYHHLFRDFLLQRLDDVTTPAQRETLTLDAAGHLEAAGQWDEAVACLTAAAAWPQLARLSCEQAPVLLNQGRHATLERWLRAIPAPQFAREPWLSFWLGNARLSFDPVEAGRHFETAFAAFAERSEEDNTPALLAWAGIVDSILFARSDFAPMLRWIGALERLSERRPGFSSPMVEARVTAAMIMALFHAQPEHPDFPRWLDRGMELLHQEIGAPVRAMLASILSVRGWWYGEPDRCRQAADASRPRTGDALLPVAPDLLSRLAELLALVQQGRYRTAVDEIHRVLEKVRSLGSLAFESEFLQLLVQVHLFTGDTEAAGKCMRRMAELIHPHQHFNYSRFQLTEAWRLHQAGEPRKALGHALEARRSATAGHINSAIVAVELGIAELYQALGETEKALKHKARLDDELRRRPNPFFECSRRFLAAHMQFAAGHAEAGREQLRQALASGRERGLSGFAWWIPELMTPLCAAALEAGIEVDYVRHLIRCNRLLPATDAYELDLWPWPVELKLLGGFGLKVDGEPVRVVGKGQHKLMAMLKTLAASGGAGMRQEALMDVLWPDAEGDAARRALDTSVHRLRKRLGNADALVLAEGRLRLDPRICRVDTLSFQRSADRIGRSLKRGGAEPDLAADFRSLLAHYRGPLLPDETGSPWLNAQREILRTRFIRLVGLTGRALQAADDQDGVVTCFQQALEREPASEPLYQLLIRAYRAQGRFAEARATLRRCETSLAAVGNTPGADTLALLESTGG